MRLRVTAGLWAVAVTAGALCFWFGREDSDPTPADRPIPQFSVVSDPFRVVIIGTSLTSRYDWPLRAQALLRACLHQPVEVHTLASAGANVEWGLKQMQRAVALEPDLVLIEFAINDADLWDGLSAQKSDAALRALVLGLRERLSGLRVGLMTMSPVEGPRGWTRPRLARRYAGYHRLSVELQTGLLDLYPRWLALPSEARGLRADGLHPDPEVAAGVIIPALVPWLASSVAEHCSP